MAGLRSGTRWLNVVSVIKKEFSSPVEDGGVQNITISQVGIWNFFLAPRPMNAQGNL